MIPRIRERRTRHDPTQINLTPLIDVLFSILIFVLASASLAAVGELPIDLPESGSATKGSGSPIVVSVGADLAIAVAGIPATLASAEETLARALGAAPDQTVVLHADRTVPAGVIVDLYDAAARAGAERIAIAAEQGP